VARFCKERRCGGGFFAPITTIIVSHEAARAKGVMLPDVAVTEMPPSNRLTVLDAENVSYGLLLSYQMSQ
jgi:hypothetical protein